MNHKLFDIVHYHSKDLKIMDLAKVLEFRLGIVQNTHGFKQEDEYVENSKKTEKTVEAALDSESGEDIDIEEITENSQ